MSIFSQSGRSLRFLVGFFGNSEWGVFQILFGSAQDSWFKWF